MLGAYTIHDGDQKIDLLVLPVTKTTTILRLHIEGSFKRVHKSFLTHITLVAILFYMEFISSCKIKKKKYTIRKEHLT